MENKQHIIEKLRTAFDILDDKYNFDIDECKEYKDLLDQLEI